MYQGDFALFHCPFCHKKTLVTNKKEDKYSCFSCGRTGKVSEERGERSGQKVIEKETPEDKEFLDIHEKAAMFYFLELGKCAEATRYLEKRNITEAAREEFGIGYAPQGSKLYQELHKDFSDEKLLDSGLFRKGEDGSLYDFFRNRIMFPIFNSKGEVIAFGGRVLDDSKPKYLNSSENLYFSKRKIMYGLPYDDIPESDTLLICEGYMDLIAAKKAGISDSAAVLGTALTKDHVKIIAKKYRRVLLGFDSDEAGMNAIKRSVGELKAFGIKVSIPNYKPAKDPDEFLHRFGSDALKKRLSEAIDASRFIAEYGTASELVDILS